MTILEVPSYDFGNHQQQNGVVGVPVDYMLGYKPYYAGTAFHIRGGVKLYSSLDTQEVGRRLRNLSIYGYEIG